jgi:hypothetical protein
MATREVMYMDSTPAKKGTKVSTFGEDAVVSAPETSSNAVGRLMQDAEQREMVLVELFKNGGVPTPDPGRTRVERSDLALYVDGVKRAPTRDDDRWPTHVESELLRVVLLAIRLLGPSWSVQFHGRDLLKVELPEDVAIAWDSYLQGETDRLIDLRDASHPRSLVPAKWPTPPPVAEEPRADVEPYSGLSSWVNPARGQAQPVSQ